MLEVTPLPFMKTFFSKTTTKKAATITTVAAFFVVACFFLGTYFYAKYLESQLQDGIEIGDVVLSAEQAEISLLHGTAAIKNLRIRDIGHKEERSFSVGKLIISGTSVYSFFSSDTLLLAKKATFTGVQGKYNQKNTSTTIALKGLSLGEVWGSPRLLRSEDPKDTFSALLSLSFRDVWVFDFTGEHVSLPTPESVISSMENKALGERQEELSPFSKEQKDDVLADGNGIRSSSFLLEEKKEHSQSKTLSDKILFGLTQKLGSQSSWSMEFAKVASFSLTHLEKASFSNIHVFSEKEEVASLAQVGVQQAEYSAIALGIPFSNIKALTLERLRFLNKKEGDITLANAEVNASLLLNGVSLASSLHELSLPKKVSPFSFQSSYEDDAQEENIQSDTHSLTPRMENSFDKYIFDASFQGSLSLVHKEDQEEILCAWQADSFELHRAKFWTLSGKGSGIMHDAVDSFAQVDFLDAKLSDTIGGVTRRIVKKSSILDKNFFYWLIMGKSTSEVYQEK